MLRFGTDNKIWAKYLIPRRVMTIRDRWGKLSPDVSWIENSRLEGIEIVGFIPIDPDFVIELRSAMDNLKPLQEKMAEYQRLGVRLGLLINPKNKQVEIYRPELKKDVLDSLNAINCNEIMPGLTLSMARIW